MEATITTTPSAVQPPQSPPAQTSTGTAWHTDIRSPSPASSDGEGEVAGGSDGEGNGSATGWKKDRLWFELDLSSREDFAKVQINPFTIAAKNRWNKAQPPPPNGVRPLNATGKAKQEPRITINHQHSSTAHQPKDLQQKTIQPDTFTKAERKEAIHQPKSVNKSTKSKTKPSPVSFGKLPKIQEGSPLLFPIVKGLQRQEQIAKVQRKQRQSEQQEQRRKQQQQKQDEQTTFASSSIATLMRPSVGTLRSQKHDIHPQEAHSELVNDIASFGERESISRAAAVQAGSDAGFRNRRMESTLHDAAQFSPPAVKDHTRTTAHAMIYPPAALLDASLFNSHYTTGDYRNTAHTSQSDYQDHDRPFWAYESPPPPQIDRRNVPANAYSAVPSSSNKLFLQAPMRYTQAMTSNYGHGSDMYTGHSRGPASSQAFSSRHAPSMVALSRQAGSGSSSHFADHAPQPRLGSLAAHRNASGRGLADSTHLDRNEDLVVRDTEWSTIPAKRKRGDTTKVTISSSTHSQPFRLPDKFFDPSSTLPKRKAHAAPSYRSDDSATEVVVVPLQRAKLTLFQPSPPKPSSFH
ncbi:hypothetical protein QFC22_000422 [Naganishia vaughanmartiniae]|uniref:Uncharacterized protein n=1 Tax=Naganishia vaughanmartiniae TaxID=1424756 RepID=A0ACC2XQ22_9TREE|nr:hypothetical protein QFC22_000422 [Naganishia vaughanmartiniae]